ncbi:MAG: hypothetical protein RIE08_12220 [Acidimicrobiales bacterium]
MTTSGRPASSKSVTTVLPLGSVVWVRSDHHYLGELIGALQHEPRSGADNEDGL